MTDPTVPSDVDQTVMCCVCSRDYEGRIEPVHARPATHELALSGRPYHYCCRCFNHEGYGHRATILGGRECCTGSRRKGDHVLTTTLPSCTRRHRCPDTEARVVEAAIALITGEPRTAGEWQKRYDELHVAVRAMEGDDDAH